jgi:hypothetical protein
LELAFQAINKAERIIGIENRMAEKNKKQACGISAKIWLLIQQNCIKTGKTREG